MQKSSKIKLCLVAALALTAAAAIAGCGEEAHTHTYSEAWAFDSASHWHAATCSHDAKINKSEHSFRDIVIPATASADGYTLHVCACGYSYTSDPTGALPAEGGYLFNEEGHWKQGEGDASSATPHDYTDETVAPTCTAKGYTKHTCACGYWYATDPEETVGHTYDEAVWESGEGAHWHTCTVCGTRVASAGHDFVTKTVAPTCEENGYTEFSCTACGYTYRGVETPAAHHFADTLTSDEYEHWRAADCGHTARADVEMHVFAEGSDTCTLCGKQIAPRIFFDLSADRSYYIVTGIGSFEGTEIVIPDDINGRPVGEIAARAFRGTNITAVTFGANVTKIGAEAFRGTAISEVELPAKLESIGAKAFAETNIAAVTLGAAVSSLGQGAFQDCEQIQTVTMNSAVLAALPPYVFGGCAKLQTVNGTTKIKSVGANAFNGCALLQSIDLSECTKAEFSAFGGCAALQNVTSLAALAAAEEYAFAGSGLAAAELPKLTAIPDNMFEGCTALASAALSAESIGVNAFKGCTALAAVTLQNTATVGEGAFNGCTLLAALTLPDTLIRVGADAFTGTALIKAEGGVNYVGSVAVGLASGTAVTLKAGTVGIADEAFKGTAITAATAADDGLRFIGVNAFRKCTALTAFEFKSNLKYIGANSFRESGIVEVTVPKTVLSVGENAFYDCMSLTTVSVSAQEIGKFAFSYTGVGRTLDSPVKVRPSGAKLATLTIGSGVKSIGSNAFQYAPIASVNLPSTLKTVGQYAFAQTDLAKLTVPDSVTRIGAYAFYGCSALTSVTFSQPRGWKVGGRTMSSLSNATTNAENLTTTYVGYEWIRG